MKLSMWDLYSELDYDDMLPVIQVGSPTICFARLLSSSHSNDEAVYVGRAGNYYGTDSDDTVIVHRDDVILVREPEIAAVFDAVLDIIEEFEAWERSLEKMAEHEDGLQEMLDASDRLLKAPAFVYAPDGRAFAISNNYDLTTHWHWAEIVANGGITSKRLRYLRDAINLPEVWKDSHPRTRCSSIGAHAYMHCSLKPNGYMAGHFVLFAFEKPFRRGLERIVDILVKAMTRHMERFYWHYSPISQMADVFARFLANGELDEETTVFLRALKWDSQDTFRVCAIREITSDEPVLLPKLLSTISRQFPLAVAFLYDNELVLLENESRSDAAEVAAKKLPSLLGSDFSGGMSMSRAGILQCRSLYRQAKRELERCAETGSALSRADDNARACIRERLANDDLLYSYVHPELVRLKLYDSENASHYYETLKVYALTNFHLSDAARYLGIHRNSLNYRLGRMRSIIDFESIDTLIDHPDEDELMYLLSSFAIIDAHLRSA